MKPNGKAGSKGHRRNSPPHKAISPPSPNDKAARNRWFRAAVSFFAGSLRFPLPSRTSEQGFDKVESLGRERGEFEGGEGTFLKKGPLSPLNISLFLLFLALAAAEEVLDALDDLVADGLFGAGFELAEEFLLTRGEVGGRLDHDLDE